MKTRIPVIIDCDPGIDDALALTVAFSLKELDIKAVCTVAGNVSIENTTRSAQTVLGVLGVKNFIYKGAPGPLMGDVIDAANIHGKSGLGEFVIQKEKLHPLEKISALEAQKNIILNSDEPITIIALGPLTNIAILLKAYPETKKNIKQISLMGGGLFSGNHTAAAEFNILADPEAAAIVYDSGVPLIMAGLDVTHKATVSIDGIKTIRAIDTDVSDMIANMLEFSVDNWSGTSAKVAHLSMHDVVSVLVLVFPDMFSGKMLPVSVETAGNFCRGYTIADVRHYSNAKPNCYVLMDINLDEFLKEIIKSIKSY